MKNIGFSDDAATNFVKMTEVVADGNVELEGKGTNPIELQTTLKQYLKKNIQ